MTATLTHCHRCGLPLPDTERYCPYCEQPVYVRRFTRLTRWRPAEYHGQVRRRALRETHVLAAGLIIFALIAAAALIAAVLAA